MTSSFMSESPPTGKVIHANDPWLSSRERQLRPCSLGCLSLPSKSYQKQVGGERLTTINRVAPAAQGPTAMGHPSGQN